MNNVDWFRSVVFLGGPTVSIFSYFSFSDWLRLDDDFGDMAPQLFAILLGFQTLVFGRIAQLRDQVFSKNDLSPDFPPWIERIRWFVFGLMLPVFAMSFSQRTHLV
ncbi:MAG: hypothetical protein AAGI92_05550 [Pseudomonadota bacterium]